MPWRIVLGSSTIIAVVLLIARIGLPESPRWLWTERRFDEAHAIAHKYMVDAAEMTDVEHEDTHTGGFGMLFSREYWRMTVFVSWFWFCNVLPYFAIATFADDVLKQYGLGRRARRWCRTVDGRGGRGRRHGRVDRQGRSPGVHRPAAVDHHRRLLGHRPVVGCACRVVLGLFLRLLVLECDEWGADEHLSRRGVPHRDPWSRHRFRRRRQPDRCRFGHLPVADNNRELRCLATILAMAVIVFSGALVSQLWAPETKGMIT